MFFLVLLLFLKVDKIKVRTKSQSIWLHKNQLDKCCKSGNIEFKTDQTKEYRTKKDEKVDF